MRATSDKAGRQRPGTRPGRRRREDAARPAHERSPAPQAPPAPPAAAPSHPEDRSRLEGGPQDRALFVCRCGSAFQALVTASVRCPHCGDPQAW